MTIPFVLNQDAAFRAALGNPEAPVMLGRLLGHRSKKLYTCACCHIPVEVLQQKWLRFDCVFASEYCDGSRMYREHLQT